MYNDVLTLTLPRKAKIVGFTDDIAVVETARDILDVEFYANEAIEIVGNWLKRNGLLLAEQKTEVVLISSRKKIGNIKITVGKIFKEISKVPRSYN